MATLVEVKTSVLLGLIDMLDIDYLKDASKQKVETNRDAVKAFFECYNSEFNHQYNQRRYPNESERLADYLQGLPSSINTPFNYCDIIKFFQFVGLVDDRTTEKEMDKYLSDYWRIVAVRLNQLKIGKCLPNLVTAKLSEEV